MKSYFTDLLPGNLRRLRQFHDYPQRYVAQYLGISQVAYSKMERGLTRLTEDRLTTLAALYNTGVDELLYSPADDLIRSALENNPAG